mmetsp:Transcript_22120/g.71598  ORF Transcript_22120/g.71598 Transcript_22120/m.71598 type:complete len:227 (-) Transcript_22120:551-1231(-)
MLARELWTPTKRLSLRAASFARARERVWIPIGLVGCEVDASSGLTESRRDEEAVRTMSFGRGEATRKSGGGASGARTSGGGAGGAAAPSRGGFCAVVVEPALASAVFGSRPPSLFVDFDFNGFRLSHAQKTDGSGAGVHGAGEPTERLFLDVQRVRLWRRPSPVPRLHDIALRRLHRRRSLARRGCQRSVLHFPEIKEHVRLLAENRLLARLRYARVVHAAPKACW